MVIFWQDGNNKQREKNNTKNSQSVLKKVREDPKFSESPQNAFTSTPIKEQQTTTDKARNKF